MALGEKIKLLRKRKNLTQQAVADLIGVSVTVIGKCENGLGDMRLSKVIKLASVFEMSVMEFIYFDGKNNNKQEILDLEKKIAELQQNVNTLQAQIVQEYFRQGLI